MSERRTLLTVFMALMMLGLPFLAIPVPSQADPVTGSLTTAIMQVIPVVGTFTGTLTTTSFTLTNGVISAVGTISGTLTDTLGNVIGTITNVPITVPLTGFTGTCTILTLHTGAINLSLLGLNVSLSPIDLVITATAAPGNLLGNLLCAVAHLLDTNGTLAQLVGLLNQILGAIRV
jgi:hypothetical protein